MHEIYESIFTKNIVGFVLLPVYGMCNWPGKYFTGNLSCTDQ